MSSLIAIAGAMLGGLIFGFAGRHYAIKKNKQESLGLIVGLSALAGGIIFGNIVELIFLP